jgi:hypothetical protein
MNFAKLNGNKVINIEVAEQQWVDEQPNKDCYIPYTSDNPAVIGGDYVDGYFYPIQSFKSWSRDGKGNWVAPVEYPKDGNFYVWDEETLAWLKPNIVL